MMVEPVTLEGKHVRLEPLREGHLDALCRAGLVPEIWQVAVAAVRTPGDMERYVAAALEDQRRGSALPFVTIDAASDTIVGSTRFGNIDTGNRRVEIGWTWINPTWQRTYINTEAKLLMLQHAFEKLGCVRVELKTDALNQRSRDAIARIGGKQEGILRRHMITESGRYRDSVYFSIINDEWPAVKADLTAKLER